MPRSRTPIGTYGEIRVETPAKVKKENELRKQQGKPIRPKQWRARTFYRYADGKSRQVERWGTTKAKAKNCLIEALKTIEADRGGSLKPTTTLRELGHRWLEAKRDLKRTEGTLKTYGYAVNAHIGPKIGDISIAEANAERLQSFLTRIFDENGAGAAKNCRRALSGMMGMAVRGGAISNNPVVHLERISRSASKKRAATAIPEDELPVLMEKIRSDEMLQKWDTVELIEFILASGWRVAEVCALDITSVNFKARTAKVEAINVRLTGKGIVRQEFAKSEKSERTTPLPEYAMELLQRRHQRLKAFTTILFPTPLMRLRDPSNTQRELRDRRELLGYPSLSTHSFRKTAATILDKAGLSAVEVAEYLGHENPSLTQDVYMNTVKGSTRAAEVLQEKLAKAS